LKPLQENGGRKTGGFWSLVTLPEDASSAAAAATPEMLRLFADLLSPALARELLRPAVAKLGRELVDPATADKSLLYNRFLRHVQLRWVRAIGEAGFDVVYMKGFANAHLFYDDPDARVIGDLDLLVRAQDLDPLIHFLSGRGFRFSGEARSPWGFISDTSFLPFVSEDASANLDLHIAPDAYPASRALSTEAVFEASRWLNIEGLRLRVPCQEHGFFLTLTNAAKLSFGPASLRKTVDALRLLECAQTLDWSRIGDLARAGRSGKALRAFLQLLQHLGANLGEVPGNLRRPFHGLVAREFAALASDTDALFPVVPGYFTSLRRELLLATDMRVGLYRNWRRVRGLVCPYRGLPPGHEKPNH